MNPTDGLCHLTEFGPGQHKLDQLRMIRILIVISTRPTGLQLMGILRANLFGDI